MTTLSNFGLLTLSHPHRAQVYREAKDAFIQKEEAFSAMDCDSG